MIWVNLLALGVLVALVLRPAGVQASDLDHQVRAVARQIRCPVCKNLSAWDSTTIPAREIVADVERRLAEGQTESEILAAYEELYGPWILMYPPRRGAFWIAWLMPFAVVALGGVGLVLVLRRWLRAQPIQVVSATVPRAPESGLDVVQLHAQVDEEWQQYF